MLVFHKVGTPYGESLREVIRIMTDFVLQAEKTPIKFGDEKYTASDVENLFNQVDTERLGKIVNKCILNANEIKDLPWYVFGCFKNQAFQAKKDSERYGK